MRLSSSCLSNLDDFGLFSERLKSAAGCPSEFFLPRRPKGSSQMAKPNAERPTLEALPSPSEASSSSLVAVPRSFRRLEWGHLQMAPIWDLQIPHLWSVPPGGHASTSPRCAFSWEKWLASSTVTRLTPLIMISSGLLQVPRPSLKH